MATALEGHVGKIGVQGQGGDSAPQLAAKDPVGRRAALLDPAHPLLSPGGGDEKSQESSGNAQARVEGRPTGPGLVFRSRGPVLALVRPELRRRPAPRAGKEPR